MRKGSNRREAKLRYMGSRYMDRRQISLEYGCSASWVYDQAIARKLAYEKRGPRLMLFRRQDVEEFFEKLYRPNIAMCR